MFNVLILKFESCSMVVINYLWAGGPSMMMLIQRICMAFRGLGKFISVAREMRVRAAMLLKEEIISAVFITWMSILLNIYKYLYLYIK